MIVHTGSPEFDMADLLSQLPPASEEMDMSFLSSPPTIFSPDIGSPEYRSQLSGGDVGDSIGDIDSGVRAGGPRNSGDGGAGGSGSRTPRDAHGGSGGRGRGHRRGSGVAGGRGNSQGDNRSSKNDDGGSLCNVDGGAGRRNGRRHRRRFRPYSDIVSS